MKLKCVVPRCERSELSTFAHNIVEGSPSKEGFHGTHGTPSGSATAIMTINNDPIVVQFYSNTDFMTVVVFVGEG